MTAMEPESDSHGTSATSPDSGGRKATQTTTTRTEVRDEFNITTEVHENIRLREILAVRARNFLSSNFLSSLAQVPLATNMSPRWITFWCDDRWKTRMSPGLAPWQQIITILKSEHRKIWPWAQAFGFVCFVSKEAAHTPSGDSCMGWFWIYSCAWERL